MFIKFKGLSFKLIHQAHVNKKEDNEQIVKYYKNPPTVLLFILVFSRLLVNYNFHLQKV